MERNYAGNDDVVFVYIQSAKQNLVVNSFDAGLAKVKKRKLRGYYGYDAPGEGKDPFMFKNYSARGTPWTLVIDHTGVVRLSRFTERNAGKIKMTIAQALRLLAKSKKG
jgi:hypothetical protein